MVAFFYSLYRALMTGTWIEPNSEDLINNLHDFWIDLSNWLLNLIGGNFGTTQTFASTSLAWSYPTIWLPLILSIITFMIICFAVFRIVKKIFSIFFVGVR